MIGDLNEKAARPRRTQMPPMEIPIRIGLAREVLLHELTDADIAYLVSASNPDEGWRWVRSIARLLAGMTPQEWSPRTGPEGT